jgi:hypothetical protein
LLIAASAAGAVVISACGGGGGEKASRAADHPRAVAGLSAAEAPRASQFPSTRGRSLQQLASLASSTAQLGAATATFTPGRRRFAFALTGSSKRFLYAPTAIYLAPSPNAPAEGPFLAPADPMTVAPQYRSQENDGPLGLHAIYWTEVPARRPGVLDVLALTRVASRLIGATGEIPVAASSPIPDVGQRPPRIATDTLATVHGKLSLLTTRLPPEQMHSVPFSRVLGRRPVALLFSTPQLCTSRVCGPVTDETVALSREFAGRIVFLHQEVYVDNQPAKGLRAQLKAFHLETEPWLFAINRRGVIAARLEGAFGVVELRRALESALR